MGHVNLYRLKLVLADGRIIWSETVEVKMDFADNKRFIAYPNPAVEWMTIQAAFPMKESFHWQLTDIMGKALQSGIMQERSFPISLHELAAGNYFLVLTSQKGQRYLLKIIKQ